MRTLLASVLVALALAAGCARSCPPAAAPARPFSMRTYYMALLYRGPAWTAEVRAALFLAVKYLPKNRHEDCVLS